MAVGSTETAVMAGHPGPAFGRPEHKLVPAIHACPVVDARMQGVDARHEAGHDAGGV